MNAAALRAAVAVAMVYGYFLLFAQFAFVEILRGAGVSQSWEKAALAVMAVAGIAGGFFSAWRGPGVRMLRVALVVAGGAAVFSPWAGGMAIAALSGCALGVATVALSALLPGWCSVTWVGLGTGVGYACCNVPAVFGAEPAVQAWIAAGFALAGAIAVPKNSEWAVCGNERERFHPWAMVAVFTALVWLDSAAFFIIQHAPELKVKTWGAEHLWRNAGMHLAAALLAGWLLRRGVAGWVIVGAWASLAVAGLAVNVDGTRGMAGWWYPVGVSLYSTALVAWPGWFSGADNTRSAAWRAAWLFAIAGWIGSANGIGMAESLQRVPVAFVAVSGAVVVLLMLGSRPGGWRAAAAVSLVLLAAWWFPGEKAKTPSVAADPERGRLVYLAEGCVNCHSQYVRPGTGDELVWGPVKPLREVVSGKPVLIGNRRQGPDLTNIGARRSEAWLREHFKDPRALAPDSAMPSYRYLFEDGRGEDLVAWLRLNGLEGMSDRMRQAAEWRPVSERSSGDGVRLFSRHCVVCHGVNGKGDGALSEKLVRRPADLTKGPFVWTAGESSGVSLKLARVMKFGIPGTDMPGHETLTDEQVNALVSEVVKMRAGK
jgi:cytochrome c oxidase cbb3-type subunit 2